MSSFLSSYILRSSCFPAIMNATRYANGSSHGGRPSHTSPTARVLVTNARVRVLLVTNARIRVCVCVCVCVFVFVCVCVCCLRPASRVLRGTSSCGTRLFSEDVRHPPFLRCVACTSLSSSPCSLQTRAFLPAFYHRLFCLAGALAF